MRHIGVDGCRSGWLAVTRLNEKLTWHLAPDLRSLVHKFPQAESIFIDVPIGLPSRDSPIRACDSRARDILGKPRRSSVFPVPCLEALKADSLDAARAMNKRCL